jgi:hypothetical protein
VHGVDVVLGVAPVALGVQVAEVERVLQAELDARGGAGDLAGDEGLAAALALVVEEDAVAGEQAVRLAVVDHQVVRHDLGRGVGAARVERGRLGLGWRAAAEHLARPGLVEPHLRAGALLDVADRLEQAQDTEAVDVGGVLGLRERDRHVRLGGEVVDLVQAAPPRARGAGRCRR